MKKIIIPVLATILSWATASGQKKITYVAKNVKLETVFKELEKKSGFSFFYRTESLKRLPKISVQFKGISIAQALDQCLLDLPLTYTISDSTVIIVSREKTK